jgi:hypothetical protein
MGLITEAGRAAMAKAIKDQAMFLALGAGNPEWGDGTPPAEDGAAAELLNEIGRKALSRSLYVVPDENGDIEVPISVTENGGSYSVTVEKYSRSETPTRYLYVEFKLDYTDAVNTTIRELGLYTGGILKATLPGGQTWVHKENFEDEGMLFEIEHRQPYIRVVNQRPVFSWVIAI